MGTKSIVIVLIVSGCVFAALVLCSAFFWVRRSHSSPAPAPAAVPVPAPAAPASNTTAEGAVSGGAAADRNVPPPQIEGVPSQYANVGAALSMVQISANAAPPPAYGELAPGAPEHPNQPPPPYEGS